MLKSLTQFVKTLPSSTNENSKSFMNSKSSMNYRGKNGKKNSGIQKK